MTDNNNIHSSNEDIYSKDVPIYDSIREEEGEPGPITTEKVNEILGLHPRTISGVPPLVIDNTPNVAIENPRTRKTVQSWLSGISLAVAVIALFFVFFPEAAFGSTIPDRAIQLVNSIILLVSGYYGLAVTRPNIPVQK